MIFRQQTKPVLDLLDFIDYLERKSKQGQKLGKLKPDERCIYLISELESEVNNGGFDQYFLNSSGKYAVETIGCLKQINAKYTADLLQQAYDTLKLAKTEEDIPVIEEKLNALDDLFYEYKEDLEALQLAYLNRFQTL